MKPIMKHNIKKSFFVKLLQSLLVITVLIPVYADDTEIFYTESTVSNNILFIMDNSGSMTAEVEGTQINDGDDYVKTSTINNTRDDTEQGDVSWNGGDGRYYYDKLRAEDPSAHWRVAYNKSLAWYYPIRKANPNSDNLELGEEYDTEIERDIKKIVGLRFTDIQVPKDAVIVSASIQFKASSDIDSVNSDPANLRVRIYKSSNRGFFGTWGNAIKSGSWFGGVNWNPPAWATPNESADAQKTSDLTSLVQYVVNRSDWRKGRKMAFKISGTGKRVAQSFDFDDGAGAPVLTITYEAEEGMKTRLQVMQDALKTVLKDAPSNLNVGIMKYGDTYSWRKNYPDGVEFPVKPLNALAKPIIEESIKINGVPDWGLHTLPVPNDVVTVGEYLTEIADSWQARGNTPIVDSLYEASLYFRGEKSAFGNYQATSWYAAHPSTYARPEPDLFEAVQQNNDIEFCGATPSNLRVWNSGIESFRNGTGWEKCPADPLNPSGPGSKANCAATENNCGSSTWNRCLDWVDQVRHRNIIGTDESGNAIYGPWIVDSLGYCRNNEYEEVTSEWCYYKKCEDKKTRNYIAEYITPTIADCQSNNIILMSDGQPETRNNSGAETAPYKLSAIKSYMGNAGCESTPFGFKSGRCGSELTHYLAENDINLGVAGDQLIDTYVIGFSSGITEEAGDYLESLVTVEDDPETDRREGYFSAQNEEELAAAFKQTLEEIAGESRSQASPGYSVNVKSGLEHEDDIYIPVFDKSTGSRWSGNLKKFKLVEEGENRYIRGKVTKERDDDANGYINAMTDLGLFKDDAWDEWSNSNIPDGNNVDKGGAASLLTNPGIRNLYTNLGITKDLSHVSNHLSDSNSNIQNNMLFDRNELGLSEEDANDHRKKLVRFIRGWINGKSTDDDGNLYAGEDVTSNARKHMGDMLHSEPVVITYKQGDDDGDGKEQYVIAATNEGYLHVFDTKTGEEKWAFMPKELLKNIHNQFTDEGDHLYGIDGSISYFIKGDDGNDGQVGGSEEVWLYFGLRRGGTSYYALNITDIDNPKLEWTIEGGTTGFEHLNQSWSAPYIANVKHNGTKKPAVIFTGGNDVDAMDYGKGDNYDPASVTGDNSTSSANGVYIVDAFNGNKLWDIMNAGVADVASKLTHGIPGGVRILDLNRNGLLDRLYFADTGGNVWRLDLKEDLSNGSVLTHFASLGGAGSNQARKFYNEPDVAILRGNGKTMLSVSLGSGLRAHPMNEEIEDHMFVLLDEKPFIPMAADFNTPIEMSDIEEVSVTGSNNSKSVVKSSDFEGKKITQLAGKKGWYVSFGEVGEKVLASSITFEGSILFTTLVPQTIDPNQAELISACAAPVTQGRLYAMDLLTGEASMNLDNSATPEPTDNDVFVIISSGEIPGTPQRIFNRLDCTGGSCDHDVDIRVGKKSTQAGTTNVSRIESVYWNAPESNK